MRDFQEDLTRLRRPRLLVSAARFGLPDYRRERMLKRLIGTVPAPGRALPRLIEEEAIQEDARRADAADYDLRRHLELVIAMMAEARLAAASEMASETTA